MVADSTQIHTYMCYSEFNEIIEPIARLDADMITIELSRSVTAPIPTKSGPACMRSTPPRVLRQAEAKA